MAGILANSRSVIMTAPTTPKSGFVGGERITLSIDIGGGPFTWTLTVPAGSHAALSGSVSVSPTFTPDIAGSYAVTARIGTVTYSMTLTATGAGDAVILSDYLRLRDKPADEIPTPRADEAIIYRDASTAHMTVRDPDDVDTPFIAENPYNPRTMSTSGAVAAWDFVYVSVNDIRLQLPAVASCPGEPIWIVCAGQCYLDAQEGEEIWNSTDPCPAATGSWLVVSDGAHWWIHPS